MIERVSDDAIIPLCITHRICQLKVRLRQLIDEAWDGSACRIPRTECSAHVSARYRFCQTISPAQASRIAHITKSIEGRDTRDVASICTQNNLLWQVC